MSQILRYFKDICSIPHPSFHEEKLADYVVAFAKEHSLWYSRDEHHNVLIKKPGQNRGIHCDPILLQGHLDMVAEKISGSDFDFHKDALELIEKDGWICAKDTTLGSDDGFAIAYMLGLLDDMNIDHPPLECLFTTKEEVGLIGAIHFDMKDIESKRCIGLDSSGENRTIITSSGGVRGKFSLKRRKKVFYPASIIIKITNATGGHSGNDITKNRVNVLTLLAQFAKDLKVDIGLSSWVGGNSENAIPTWGTLILGLYEKSDELMHRAKDLALKIQDYSRHSDPAMKIDIEFGREVAGCPKEETHEIIESVLFFPQGVAKMSDEIEGLPLLSANIGFIRHDEYWTIGFSVRSPMDVLMEHHMVKIETLAKRMRMDVEFFSRYPGFPYQPESTLRNQFETFYQSFRNQNLNFEATHGGCELGIWKGKIPQLDIISMGPINEGIHTPQERMDLASFERVYENLVGFLAYLCHEAN